MRLGFISMPVPGHLNPMTALARRLKSRGHEIVFIGVPDSAPIVQAAGLGFMPYCEQEFPPGAVSKGYADVAKLRGLEAAEYSIGKLHPKRCRAALQHLPERLSEAKIDALVIDTIHFFVELVPMRLGIPYVHIWNILHLDLSGQTPPCFFDWPYENSPEGFTRNGEGVKRIYQMLSPVAAIAKEYAAVHNLDIDFSDFYATASRSAVITQTPKEFDLPMSKLPSQFHYAGPFHDALGRESIDFPYERLTRKPLIYASMGTLLNGREQIYREILESIRQCPDLQAVLSIGKTVRREDLEPIPENAIVVPRAPQLELLRRASLCITHAGLNTALEALANGVPMVAIPVGFDQPGVAARIQHHRVGECLNADELTSERLTPLIRKVLEDSVYHDNAYRLQKVIQGTRGLDVAADVIERAFGCAPR
jgi:zeaxanthin glucosyltransferase